MKNRLGFVSNSSSTSFYINGNKYTKEIVEETIKELLDIINKIDTDYQINFDECVIIYDNVNIEDIKIEFKGYDFNYLENSVGNKNIIQVNSISDNSIPDSIQEFLENHFNAYGQHWG